jgi:hypothetical protein
MHVGTDRLRLWGETGAAWQGTADQSWVTAALWSKDKAIVASSEYMSRSLDQRHKVRLYVEKAGLWNPADADVELHI